MEALCGLLLKTTSCRRTTALPRQKAGFSYAETLVDNVRVWNENEENEENEVGCYIGAKLAGCRMVSR